MIIAVARFVAASIVKLVVTPPTVLVLRLSLSS